MKQLEGCEKCGFTNHKSGNCKLSYLECRVCSKDHFTYLCPKEPAKDKSLPTKLPRKSTNNMLWATETMTLASKEGATLHTFTCDIKGKTVRAMKDSGCETTLILKSIADEQGLEVLENDLPLIINGFNSSKRFKTTLVKVPVYIGNSLQEINAVTVSEISIMLKLNKLGIVAAGFKERGYILADRLISKRSKGVSDIGLILGTDYSYLLPVTTIVFGGENSSSIASTPHGVMLEGQLSKVLNNIDMLPLRTQATAINLDSADSVNLTFRSKNITGLAGVDAFGKISEATLQNATDQILNQSCSNYLNKEQLINADTSELNDKLVDYVLKNTNRLEDGKLQMPLMWKNKIKHLLGNNYELARQILKTNLKKLSKDPKHLMMTDDVFKEQEKEGIIEKITNLDQFIAENPQCSFLPHMSVFRLHKETTKCRVVYLSNLCGKDASKPLTVCHSQTIHSGPNLNSKLTTSVLLLKFDPCLLVFDIKHAFLNIALSEADQAKLLTLWYRNVAKKDFSLVAYKQKTVLFGVSCSPCLLMLALYKILILDNRDKEKLTRLKELVYSLTYMDNGAFSSNKKEDIAWPLIALVRIFKQYQFQLQQFATNDEVVQRQLDEATGEPTAETVNLLSLRWNRCNDQLSVKQLRLKKLLLLKEKF